MDEGENNELFEAYVEDFEEKIIEVDDYFDVLVSEIGKKQILKFSKEKTPTLNKINNSLKALKIIVRNKLLNSSMKELKNK
jgi:hypothetical protein